MRENLQQRLDELKKEFEKGQLKLQELQMQQTHLHETLLRISGAMKVVHELLEQESSQPQHNEAVSSSVETSFQKDG